MGLTSLQVCMDSSDWLQGTLNEDSSGLDSSSPSGGDLLTCSRPLMERRLRPPHDQALKCPRCESTHTKFCYYNNYSLSQPRYFCKTCRRYWTKGGTLRNIPVGGGCRKNKKVSSSSSNNNSSTSNANKKPNELHHQNLGSSSSSLSHNQMINPTDLHLSSFPDQMQFPHLGNLLNHHNSNPNFNFMMENQNPRPIDFMESKFEALVGSSSSSFGRNYDFMGNNITNGLAVPPNVSHGGINCSPSFGMSSLDGNGSVFMDTSCQRLMLPYDANDNQGQNTIDVKPNPKLLSLDWQDHQGCSDAGKDSFGYMNGNLGSWTAGMINGYGSSATNSLV